MKIRKEDNHILIKARHDSVVEFASDLTKRHEEFKNDNLILDISSYENLELEEMLSFLELSNVHREDKKSFVIINNAIPIEKIPDELCVVPSLQEAKDVIQMDEIQRELGF
ncbi:MAG: ribonuclease Z [Bacteroidota bacterium]